MGILGGPDLIENGLVLLLDAADSNSYPGTGTTWIDLSGGGRTATQQGSGTTFATTRGGVFTFNGNGYFNFATSFLPTNYTKECWFYKTASNQYMNLISGNNSNDHTFWVNGGFLQGGQGGDFGRVSTSYTLTNNIWYYAAVTFNTTSGWVLYVNGLSVTTSASTTLPNGYGLFIGAYNDGSSNRWVGDIANVRIYNVALTASQILNNYNAMKSRFGL